MSCDPITGQCNCEEFKVSQNKFVKKNKYETRRCDGCPNDQYHKSAEDRTCVGMSHFASVAQTVTSVVQTVTVRKH